MGARRTAAGLAVALAAVAALVGCGSEDNGGTPHESDSASPTTSQSPSTSASASDGSSPDDHALEPPGPLTEPLRSADILVVAFGRKSLPDELVAGVEQLDGVQATELVDLGSVSLENEIATVAGVDPGSYRRFTAAGQADEVWQRVAGGELAIGQELADKAQDSEAFVKLGNDKDAPKVHVGAYVDQVLTVDMVVNRSWGKEIGLVPGNALLISTGITSPQQVQKQLRRLTKGAASIQMLDAVAQFGLDPDATQTAYLSGGSVAAAVGSFSYKVIGGGRIAPDPAWVSANIRTEVVPILGSVTCHRVVLPQLRAALIEVQQRGLADKIHRDQYAGCYYPRFIANSSKLSLHSFGIALDLNVAGNGRGTVGEIDRTVVSIFKKWGFGWGGDWKWTDPMHFEMNALVEAR